MRVVHTETLLQQCAVCQYPLYRCTDKGGDREWRNLSETTENLIYIQNNLLYFQYVVTDHPTTLHGLPPVGRTRVGRLVGMRVPVYRPKQ